MAPHAHRSSNIGLTVAALVRRVVPRCGPPGEQRRISHRHRKAPKLPLHRITAAFQRGAPATSRCDCSLDGDGPQPYSHVHVGTETVIDEEVLQPYSRAGAFVRELLVAFLLDHDIKGNPQAWIQRDVCSLWSVGQRKDHEHRAIARCAIGGNNVLRRQRARELREHIRAHRDGQILFPVHHVGHREAADGAAEG